jgi:hypothetical protein
VGVGEHTASRSRQEDASHSPVRRVGTPVDEACTLQGEQDLVRALGCQHAVSGQLGSGQAGQQFASLGVQLGARYDASPIVAADCSPPADSWTVYTPTSIPGGRAPHLWLDDWHGVHSSIFDRFGVGFTLLRLGTTPSSTAALEAAARVRGVPLTLVDVADPAARDLYDRDLAMIRPDQHVAWRGNHLPADVDGLLGHVVGARPASGRCLQARGGHQP